MVMCIFECLHLREFCFKIMQTTIKTGPSIHFPELHKINNVIEKYKFGLYQYAKLHFLHYSESQITPL